MNGKRLEATLIYVIAYLIATVAAVSSFNYWFRNESLVYNLFYADLVGSICIYIGCIILNSFSLYDPYWSYQCNIISFYYLWNKRNNLDMRSILVFFLVNIWSIRLNSNFIINGIDDKNHEDWRYTDFRHKFPTIIGWLIGFFTFIFLPTFLVFFGCLPLLNVYQSKTDLNYIDLIAFITTLIGITFEGVADHQLRKELATNKKLALMDKGLWSLCRHPNYFGEISFWFGLFTFAISSGAFQYNLLIGPVGIFVIIYFGSLPMMEERQLVRRANSYRDYIKRVPFKLLPLNFFKYKTQ